MDIYLSVTAADYPKAAGYASRFAFVSYGIGPDDALLRGSLPILSAPSRTVWNFPPPMGKPSRQIGGTVLHQASGEPHSREPYQRDPPPPRRNLLSLSDRDAPPVEHPETLCGYVSRECARRGYDGAVLDFEERTRDDLRSFVGQLSRRFAETGRRLYVPEAYANATTHRGTDNGSDGGLHGDSYSGADSASGSASVLLCTALSGGNFEERLREAVERRGGTGVALDVQRLRMDFTLPAPTGEGVPLDADTFLELAEGRTVYFSPDLCARYFTFTQSGAAHFVLFDDGDTLNRKLDLGRRYGVRAAFLQWPEIADIAEELRLN